MHPATAIFLIAIWTIGAVAMFGACVWFFMGR